MTLKERAKAESGLLVQNLTVSLGKSQILFGIDLKVPAGSFFSLLGPSGCGKSTLLKTIAGLIAPHGGHILWNGEAIDALPPEKRDVVMVFQDLRLFPHMTVLDNIAFPLKMAGKTRPARQQAAQEMLAMVQLEGLEHRRPHQLSGGQQQRVVLARALVAKPRVLLLDEPFSSLDAPLRADMRALVKQLHTTLGTTMLLVTHDQAEALAMSDTMAVMAPGRILQTGTPQAIYRRPNSLAVARHFFWGNQISGRVKDGCFEGGGLAFAAPPGVAEGEAIALLPPESLALEGAPGPFRVQTVEYAGTHLTVSISNGKLTLQTSIPAERATAPGDSLTLFVHAEKVLFFPR